MKNLMFFTLLSVLILSCKRPNDINTKKPSKDDTSYDIRYNSICCDRSYGVLEKKGKEKIYYLGRGPILVEKADLKTFKAYDGFKEIDGKIYDAEDKNNYYKGGKIVKKK
jgi:hypothetical protein